MASFKIEGKVVEVTLERSGVSQAGREWKMQDIVVAEPLKDGQQYQDQVVITIDRMKLETPNVGSEVTVHCNIRKSKGYFNNVMAWKIEVAEQKAQAVPQPTPQAAQPVVVFDAEEESDMLPF